MLRLLVLADDFTGALDTGVQFSKFGATVQVTTNVEYSFAQAGEPSILVMDLESRHLAPGEAYRLVRSASERALAAGIPNIYKKTDSALRGNIGAELSALLDASDQRVLPFVPAFPKMKRITIDGVHYFDGIPIDKTVFGRDPFEPVTRSYIPDIIREQCETPVRIVRDGGLPKPEPDGKTILVFDAQSGGQLEALASSIRQAGLHHISAGCAGFAEFLPGLFGIPTGPLEKPHVEDGVIIVSGSINPISVQQLVYAKRNGFPCLTLTPGQKLDRNYPDSDAGAAFVEEAAALYRRTGRLIVESGDGPDATKETDARAAGLGLAPGEAREMISKNIGTLAGRIIDRVACTVVLFGGDTLTGFMDQAGQGELVPLAEIEPGVVMSRVSLGGAERVIVSKSGGFGDVNIVSRIVNYLSYLQQVKEKA